MNVELQEVKLEEVKLEELDVLEETVTPSWGIFCQDGTFGIFC